MGSDISALCAQRKRDRKEGRRGVGEESVGLRSHVGHFFAVKPENEAAENGLRFCIKLKGFADKNKCLFVI